MQNISLECINPFTNEHLFAVTPLKSKVCLTSQDASAGVVTASALIDGKEIFGRGGMCQPTTSTTATSMDAYYPSHPPVLVARGVPLGKQRIVAVRRLTQQEEIDRYLKDDEHNLEQGSNEMIEHIIDFNVDVNKELKTSSITACLPLLEHSAEQRGCYHFIFSIRWAAPFAPTTKVTTTEKSGVKTFAFILPAFASNSSSNAQTRNTMTYCKVNGIQWGDQFLAAKAYSTTQKEIYFCTSTIVHNNINGDDATQVTELRSRGGNGSSSSRYEPLTGFYCTSPVTFVIQCYSSEAAKENNLWALSSEAIAEGANHGGKAIGVVSSLLATRPTTTVYIVVSSLVLLWGILYNITRA